MSSVDTLGALRERNKDLLTRLKQQMEKLERLSGCSHGRKREREAGAEEDSDPAEVCTRTDGESGVARAALAKPTVRFADTCERQTGIQRTISATAIHRGGTEHKIPSDLFKEGNRHTGVHSRLQDTRPAATKSCLTDHSKEKREVRSQVTFQSDECKEMSASDRHHLQPLLGYDWIAGVLDADDSLIERSDEFFKDLCMFRSLNKDDCVHNPQAEFLGENLPALSLLADKGSPEANMDTHQCTFSYRINSRLFPVPLHSNECCPVCKKHKSSHPHTAAEPALIRVSIPRSSLLPSHKYKAHRRCSFDPSDSLGLPSHCLSGWSNTGLSMLLPPSSLDLRSSLDTKSSLGSQSKELEDRAAFKVSSQQISDVSRLARHNFQHFSPHRKRGSTSHSLY